MDPLKIFSVPSLLAVSLHCVQYYFIVCSALPCLQSSYTIGGVPSLCTVFLHRLLCSFINYSVPSLSAVFLHYLQFSFFLFRISQFLSLFVSRNAFIICCFHFLLASFLHSLQYYFNICDVPSLFVVQRSFVLCNVPSLLDRSSFSKIIQPA
jgi:hypothetical protein